MRIERPSAQAKRVPVARLLAIGVSCFLLGIGAVVLNAGGKRIVVRAPAATPLAESSNPGSAEVVAPVNETDPPGAAAVQDTTGTPAFVIAEADAGALALMPEPLDAGAEVPTATPFTGARRVEPGRVAYLRCEGVPQRPGPYPCPRDEALEAAVWAVLDTLPRCAEAPAGLGESDVRLEFIAGAPTDAKLRAPRPGVPRLDGPAILRCTAGPLSHVTTTTGATKLVLSFRFALVDASQPRAR